MPPGSNIQYLSHHEIDKAQWDQCIDEADNGLIYGYSFYLDQMARHWDGLVLNNYEAVMPLVWNKKYGIYYLYQPPFTACLGAFGKNLNEELLSKFLPAIPKKFKLIEISLNHRNILHSPAKFFISRTNYILWLNKSYDQLYHDYRENHQRNIQKCIQAGFMVKKNIALKEIIALSKAQMKKITSLSAGDYDRFTRLYEFLSTENKTVTYGIVGKQNELLASCVFFFSHKRAYYILVGNHPNGRNTGASHALVDAFIKDHAGQDLLLDFEGSDIESLGLFYSGFGASREVYGAIRWSRLPWYLKWMKHNY